MKKTCFSRAILSVVLCLCFLFGFGFLSLGVFAAEETDANTTAPTADGMTESEAPKESEASPLTAEIAALIKEHAPTVLSAASLLLMTAITLFFKKGVLPKLLSLFESLFQKSGETLSSLSDYERAVEGRLSSLLARGEEVFASAEGIKETEGALRAALLESQSGNSRFAALFSEQSALLFELLMSANLPQYQKDRVAAVHQETKACLDALSATGSPEKPSPEKEK